MNLGVANKKSKVHCFISSTIKPQGRSLVWIMCGDAKSLPVEINVHFLFTCIFLILYSCITRDLSTIAKNARFPRRGSSTSETSARIIELRRRVFSKGTRFLESRYRARARPHIAPGTFISLNQAARAKGQRARRYLWTAATKCSALRGALWWHNSPAYKYASGSICVDIDARNDHSESLCFRNLSYRLEVNCL